MFKNLKIGKKLVISFLLVSIIASISSVVCIVLTKSIQSKYSNILVDYGFSQGEAGKLLAEITKVNSDLHNAITYKNVSNKTTNKNNFENGISEIDTLFNNLSLSITTDEEKSYFNAAKQTWSQYKTSSQQLITKYNTSSTSTENTLINEIDPMYNSLYDSLSSIINNKSTNGNELSSSLSIFTNTIIGICIALMIITFVCAILLGISLSKIISVPLNKCSQRLELLADGDLLTPVEDVDTNDEIKDLIESSKKLIARLSSVINDEKYLLTEMAGGNFDLASTAEEDYVGDFKPIIVSIKKINNNLNSTLFQINQTSQQVTNSAEQVATGAQALSQGATEQASSIEELAATINDISTHVTDTAENAGYVSEKVKDISNDMEESNLKMANLMSAMQEITNSSTEIGKIIKTIEDIAFQTNILALNAAVEAARAGAAGKGFAVVADEVRNLASKSAEASQNTASLIENSIKAVENGSKIATETAEALNSVLTKKDEIVNIVDKISSASSDQANSISQITIGIDQISSVVQTNSATAEESAAASQELSGQAELLQQLFKQFKLRNNSTNKTVNLNTDEFINTNSDESPLVYDVNNSSFNDFNSKY